MNQGNLQAVFDVLDELCGDTDPVIPDDFTDDDIREEHPLFWRCREVGKFLVPPAELKTRETVDTSIYNLGLMFGQWIVSSGPDVPVIECAVESMAVLCSGHAGGLDAFRVAFSGHSDVENAVGRVLGEIAIPALMPGEHVEPGSWRCAEYRCESCGASWVGPEACPNCQASGTPVVAD